MENKIGMSLCQGCGMSLNDENKGAESDGSILPYYCVYSSPI